MVTVNSSSMVRISVSSGSAPGNAASYESTISGDGRFVAFTSLASTLVPEIVDPASATSIVRAYVRDTQSGTTRLISMDYDGGAMTSVTDPASISDDGRMVVFRSGGDRLIEGDALDGIEKIYLRDMESGVTTRIITGSDAVHIYTPKISGDGRYVTYMQAGAIYRYDTLTTEGQLASIRFTGQVATGVGAENELSADGRFVAFVTDDNAVVAGDGNGFADIFLRDIDTGTTTRVSVTDSEGEANGASQAARISATGRFVVFTSNATNLIAGGDTNDRQDIYLRDTLLKTTKLVSVGIDGAPSDKGSEQSDVSSDGRFVVFTSYATNLVADDNNGYGDVFLRDMSSGTTVRLSVGRGGYEANASCYDPEISDDGRSVSFNSAATNLTPGDSNHAYDVFRVSLFASAGSDYLFGSGVADSISGLGGSDIIEGGRGADTMNGGSGNDTFYVDTAGDVVIEAAGGGRDKVYASTSYSLSATADVETLIAAFSFSTAPINLTGNGIANTLIGNAYANTLDGKAGADVMQGGNGDDRYFVDTSGDVIIEVAGEGVDKVYASVGYTLKAGVEVEFLGTTNANSTAKLNLVGNEFANGISGNAAANGLSGMAGADTLNGYLGNDTLKGGTGDDAFIFSTVLNVTTNLDHIGDFANVTNNNDRIVLDNIVFTKLTTTGALAAGAFKASTTGNANDLDDRILYKTGTGELFYDADGNKAGGVAAIKFAVIDNFPSLTGTAALSAADFFVV